MNMTSAPKVWNMLSFSFLTLHFMEEVKFSWRNVKFIHVVSCQIYGLQKISGDPEAQDIRDLMIRYPSLHVAYVEEKEEIMADKPRKVYSSILVKDVKDFDQEVYCVKLPGPPNI